MIYHFVKHLYQPGRVRFDARPTRYQANSMPSHLDAKIYSQTFKLLFTSGVGIESAASSWSISVPAVSVGVTYVWLEISVQLAMAASHK